MKGNGRESPGFDFGLLVFHDIGTKKGWELNGEWSMRQYRGNRELWQR
jgi:hypothetical protein